MSHPDWPTWDDVRAMTAKAIADDFVIRLLQIDTGFEWTWKHTPSGMEFEGSCDCHVKAIAFVCALQELPVIIFRPEDVDNK